MMMNQLVKRSIILKQRIPATVALLGMRYPMRAFALPKYSFEGEAFQPDRFQMSAKSHKTNAEELINSLPIVEVDGDTARCSGVNQFGLGHPVQYI